MVAVARRCSNVAGTSSAWRGITPSKARGAGQVGERLIRILVLDDDVGFAALAGPGLAAQGIEVVGVVAGLAEVVERSAVDRPDVVVADIDLGRGLALDLPARLPDDRPPVLWYSGHDERYREAAYRAGGEGYVSKREPHERLVEAIRRLADGEVVWTQADARAARRAPRAPTPTEIEKLTLMAAGLSNREVAAELGLSTRGVESAIRRMLDRYGLDNRVELVELGRRQGWIGPPPVRSRDEGRAP